MAIDLDAIREAAKPYRDKGWTLAEIGLLLGVSETTVQRACSHRRVDRATMTGYLGRYVYDVNVADAGPVIVVARVGEVEAVTPLVLVITVERTDDEPFRSWPTRYVHETAWTEREAWEAFAERQKSTIRGLFRSALQHERHLKCALRELHEL